MIEVLYFSLVAASATYLFNYCIGKPGSKEFSPNEIFSSYTVWLSVMRLKKMDLYKKYVVQYNENVARVSTIAERATLDSEFKKLIYDAAEPFFFWEKALGICINCTGFWVSLIVGLTITQNFSELIEIIVISHVTIRILNKIL